MSYEEFVKLHGKPQPRPTTSRTPVPTRSPAAPRIDTRFATTVSGASRSGSLSGSPDAERTDVTLYLARLYDAIRNAWQSPGPAERTVSVNFDIAPNGRISNIHVVKSSGDAAYDQSVVAAIRAVGSIGPTPGGVTLERNLNFNLKAE